MIKRIKISDNYIIGFPDETFGQIRDSLNFSLEMGLDWSNFAVYQHNVNYFGDERSRKDAEIGDFIPTKDLVKGKIGTLKEVLEGPDIFDMPPDNVPSREQLSQIWFTSNLVRNFIGNRNLGPEGIPKKFIDWTSVVEERYPTHPYMNFFLALGHILAGDKEKSEIQKQRMLVNLEDPYWQRRFSQFGMSELVFNFPNDKQQTLEALAFLRKKNLR